MTVEDESKSDHEIENQHDDGGDLDIDASFLWVTFAHRLSYAGYRALLASKRDHHY